MLGWNDLKPQIVVTDSTVECPVRDCGRNVNRQKKKNTVRRDDQFLCPVHHLYISPTTFEYVDYRENLLWTSDVDCGLLKDIAGEKRENRRLVCEQSEDAVTWNVFRHLERHNLLREFAAVADGGRQPSTEPSIVYWS